MRKVALREVASIERSSVGPEAIADGETYVGLENVSGDGGFVDVGTVSAGDLKSNKFRFGEEHVLYGKLRPYLAKIAAPDFGGVCSTDILPIRPGPDLDRRYLLHYLRSPRMVAMASKLSHGINLPRLSPEALNQFGIPLPPIEEQRRIAAVLDAADALRAKRREALAKLDDLRSSLVSENLGRYTERELLGDHLTFVTSGSRGWAKYYSDSGQRFIRSQDVLMGSIDEQEPAFVTPPDNSEARRTVIQEGDLLITITGTVGRVAAAPRGLEGAFISQHVSIARPSPTLRPAFAAAFMTSQEGQRQLDSAQYGQTKPGLNLTQIREFRIPVPRLEQQDGLLRKLDLVSNQALNARRSEVKLNDLFASLQQRAFRGEL